jgi:hypothetical protein
MLRPYMHNFKTLQIRPLDLKVFLHLDKHGVDSTSPPGFVA